MNDLLQEVQRTPEAIETVKKAGLFARLIPWKAVKVTTTVATVTSCGASAVVKVQELEMTRILPELWWWSGLLAVLFVFAFSGLFAWAYWRSRRVPEADWVSTCLFRIACATLVILALSWAGWVVIQTATLHYAIACSLIANLAMLLTSVFRQKLE